MKTFPFLLNVIKYGQLMQMQRQIDNPTMLEKNTADSDSDTETGIWEPYWGGPDLF